MLAIALFAPIDSVTANGMQGPAAVPDSSHAVTNVTAASAGPRQARAPARSDGAFDWGFSRVGTGDSSGAEDAPPGETRVGLNLSGLATDGEGDVQASSAGALPETATELDFTLSGEYGTLQGLVADFQIQPASTVTSITLSAATSTATTVTVAITQPGTATLYLRYREIFDETWSTLEAPTAGSVDFVLTGAPPDARLVVQASFDSTFADGTEVAEEIRVRPVQLDFVLPEVESARGIWVAGDTLWVVSDEGYPKGRVEAYSLSSKTYQPGRSFALYRENTDPRGVYADGTTMWVTDEDDRVYAYTITAGGSFGDLDLLKVFDVSPDRGVPAGAWSDGSTIWIAGHVLERLYAYNIGASGTFGARDDTKERDLVTVYGEPKGLWSDGSTLWVLDGATARLHAYALGADGIGDREPARDLGLVAENESAWGIASSDDVLWVADAHTGTLYAYFLPAAPGGDLTGLTFDSVERTEVVITVSITNPTASPKTVRLEYVRAADGDRQSVSQMTSGTSTTFMLTGLRAGNYHDLRVTLDATDSLRAGFKTPAGLEEVREFLREGVVEAHEAQHGWLRETYNHMRRSRVKVTTTSQGAGHIERSCSIGAATCSVTAYRIGTFKKDWVHLHELGHVYSLDTGIEVERGTVGMGWLYFAELVDGGTDCEARELYADAIRTTVSTRGQFAYYGNCTNTPSTPSADTRALGASVMRNEVPDWFDDEYASVTVPYDTSEDPMYDENYDLEQVWADVKKVEDLDRIAAVTMFGGEFGGYCNAQEAYESSSPDSATRNPWNAGGCFPQAPAITLAPDGLVTWEEPYDGGEDITRYFVQWSRWNEEFSLSRGASIHDLSNLSYATGARSPGATVRVRARNVRDWGPWTTASQAVVSPGPPVITSVDSGDGALTVSWNAPANKGGAAITRYDVRHIRSDDTDKTDDARWTEFEGAWTSGDRQHTITGLTNSVSYDVQVRAVNSIDPVDGVDPGDWSSTQVGTPASAVATLSALTLSDGWLDTPFASDTDSYTASVGYQVTQITVTPTPSEPNATITFPGTSDASSADGHQVNLSVGATNAINVRVTAANGVTTQTYTVTVTRTGQDTSLTPPPNDPSAPFASEAVYTVTFTGTWTTAVTPDGVPAGAHFSRLIGAVHNAGVTFLQSGGTASAGVESMAEDGGTSTLTGEVNIARNADPPTALSVLEGATSLSNRTLTTEFPRVTLVTMVAPSPDWFVGVSGLPLLNSSGRWLRSHSLNLYPWDAGTEEGTEFSFTNPETDPPGTITSIRGSGRFSTEPIATLSFELQSVRTTRNRRREHACRAPRAAHHGGGHRRRGHLRPGSRERGFVRDRSLKRPTPNEGPPQLRGRGELRGGGHCHGCERLCGDEGNCECRRCGRAAGHLVRGGRRRHRE